jgi:uncharacterized membrane protein
MRDETMADPSRHTLRHPGVERYLQARAGSWQARLADWITAFAGSMTFVYAHVVAFAAWMLLVEANPWPTLTLVVSLEAIFLSTFVLIGQNRQSAVAQAKADHDFVAQELELRTNTELTRAVHALLLALEQRLIALGGDQSPACDTTVAPHDNDTAA